MDEGKFSLTTDLNHETSLAPGRPAIYSYRLTIAYKGTRYQGWQIQQDQVTIQGTLLQALKQLCFPHQAQVPLEENLESAEVKNISPIKIIGSGRTDAGVHAIKQVIRVDLPRQLPLKALTQGLNNYLPSDIFILQAEESSRDFHPIRDALWKEYHYLFMVGERPGPFWHDFVAVCPYRHLNLSLMEEACQLLLGTHDFSNFFCVGTEVSHNIREIYQCSLEVKHELGLIGPGDLSMVSQVPLYHFKIRGNGFLKQMVRLLVGCLWNIGREKVTLLEFQQALKEKRPHKLGIVAPPQGLYLKEIHYPN